MARREPPAGGPPSDVLVLCVPTRDHMGLITSVMTWHLVAQRLGRPLLVVQGQGSNIPRARNTALEAVVAQLGPGPRWIAWWDTDILLTPDQVAPWVAAMQWAEAHGPGAVLADYAQEDGTRTVFTAEPDGSWVPWPAPQPRPTDPYVPVVGGGLGLAYVWMDPATTFTAGRTGEDVAFWQAYPYPIHWATQVRVLHRKAVWLP